MTFLEKIDNPNDKHIERLLEKNNISITSKELKDYFNSLSEDIKKDYLSENSEIALSSFYELLVINYTHDILGIEELESPATLAEEIKMFF